jgi:putative peptide zinc metalloprotease protein
MIPPLLPPLREELRLLAAAPNPDGSPAWMVQDPVNNRFYRIGWLDFELLLHWASGTPEQVVEAVNAETTLTVHPEDVEALWHFLEYHNLLQARTPQAVERLQKQAKTIKPGVFKWLVYHYLFFRIPLIRPQFWLKKLLPWFEWLYSRAVLTVILAFCLAGIFLAVRQWDVFLNTFVDKLTWSGLLGYAVALAFAKALHEMAHALTATRYGVRVAHMGVAMVVLYPMLYTDTSESWKLSRPRQRLAIASAGILAELGLAGLATLGWSLAPEGSVKNALFFLATTSWVLSLAINASPFMRFDGYFILSDILDIPNLHERSGALATTWLRRLLLGFKDSWPERLPGHGNALLIVFAILTWLYRLTVFLGIALLVYHFFFKLLGVVLFILELVVFIARPVWSELTVWFKRRKEIAPGRRRIGWLLSGALFIILLVPWQSSVYGVGWVHAARQHLVYSPLAGRLLTMPGSDQVKAGEALFVLESPDLNISAAKASNLAEARAKELTGLMGFPEGEARRTSLKLQQERFLAEARLFQQEQLRLKLTAPFGGELRDVDEHLAPGVWVHPRQPLAILVDLNHWVVEACIPESDISRIRPGNRARVQIQSSSPYFLNGHVTEVDTTRMTVLPNRILDAQAGGPIASLPGSGKERQPREALYRVRISLEQPPVMGQMGLGKVVIHGEARAWIWAIFERIGVVFIRESGF